MLSGTKEWQVIQAEGDGNCALNAYVLGLRKLALDGRLDKDAEARYKTFLDELVKLDEFKALAGSQARWEAFKTYLKAADDEQSLKKLQRLLAPLFRSFSIEELIKKRKGLQGEHHQEAMFVAVETEFRNHVLKNLGTPVPQKTYTQDDICARLNCVGAEFEKLFKAEFESKFARHKALAEMKRDKAQDEEFARSKIALEARIEQVQRDALLKDWNSKVYQESLAAMAKSGAWAGDLELAPLAEFFGVELDIQRHLDASSVIVHHIHYDYGKLDTSELKQRASVVDHLRRLDVIDATPVAAHVYRWKEAYDEKTMDALLSAATGSDMVHQFIAAQPREPVELKGCKVRSQWQAHVVDLLKSRGVIEQKSDGNFFIVTREELEAKIIPGLPTSPTNIQDLVKSEVLRVTDKIQDKAIEESLVGVEECKQLRQRGVLKLNDAGQHIFAIGEMDAVSRMNQVDSKDDVFKLWKDSHIVLPTITLANESATHWDLLVEKPSIAATLSVTTVLPDKDTTLVGTKVEVAAVSKPASPKVAVVVQDDHKNTTTPITSAVVLTNTAVSLGSPKAVVEEGKDPAKEAAALPKPAVLDDSRLETKLQSALVVASPSTPDLTSNTTVAASLVTDKDELATWHRTETRKKYNLTVDTTKESKWKKIIETVEGEVKETKGTELKKNIDVTVTGETAPVKIELFNSTVTPTARKITYSFYEDLGNEKSKLAATADVTEEKQKELDSLLAEELQRKYLRGGS